MKPLGFIDALALLLSDSTLRARFAADPATVVRELRVAEEDAMLLCGMDQEKLANQACALIDKRRAEVARLIPITWSRLAEDALNQFQNFAESAPWPTGHQRHLEDASAFCQFLKSQASKAVSQSEHNWIEFATENRRMAIQFVRDPNPNGKHRVGLQVLFRDRVGRARHRTLWVRWFSREQHSA